MLEKCKNHPVLSFAEEVGVKIVGESKVVEGLSELEADGSTGLRRSKRVAAKALFGRRKEARAGE